MAVARANIVLLDAGACEPMPEQPGCDCGAVVVDVAGAAPDPALDRLLRAAGVPVVGRASSAAGALALIDCCRPALLIVRAPDGAAPGPDVGAVLEQALAIHPALVAVVVPARADGSAGAVAAVAVAAGFGARGREPDVLLTRREREVLSLVADGLTNAQIAAYLWVTRDTVKFHLANAFRKLGIGRRADAARAARERGLLEPRSLPRQ